MHLREVDHIEVIALMDNLSDPFSVSHPGMKFNELQYQYGERKCRKDDGANLCRACLGLSLLIRAKAGNETFCILFDTGPDDGLAVENASRLGVNLREVDVVCLSHGHFDHISGIVSCLKGIGKKNIPVHCHPDVFLPRAALIDGDEMVISSVQKEEDVASVGGVIVKAKDPTHLFDERILLSGEVTRRTQYETGAPGELTLSNGEWRDSSAMLDEQLLILNLKGKGICVFTGCGHPGVVNSLRYAQDLVSERIHLIMGGFHLAGPEFASRVDATVHDLAQISPDYLITGHCTGFKAQSQLSVQFGDRHIPYGVGTVFRFAGDLGAVTCDAIASEPPNTYALGTGQEGAERLEYQSNLMNSLSFAHVEKAGLKSGQIVYDVACGTGSMTAYLAKAVGPIGHIYAIDRSEEQLALARKRIEDAGLTNVTFIQADVMADALPCPQPADMVYARLILMHLINPEHALSNMVKLLKTGGLILLQEPENSTNRAEGSNELTPLVETLMSLGHNRNVDYDMGLRIKQMAEDQSLEFVDQFVTHVAMEPNVARSFLLLSFNEWGKAALKDGLMDQPKFDHCIKMATNFNKSFHLADNYFLTARKPHCKS